MDLERLQDLSIYYWLEDIFQSYPSVNIEDGYPEGDLILPTVSIEDQDITPGQGELGKRTRERNRVWIIDVYGENKAQRDEMASIILNDLENGIPVYNYNEGFPPDNSPTQIGLLMPLDWRVRTIRIFPELMEKAYWRKSVRFMTVYNTI